MRKVRDYVLRVVKGAPFPQSMPPRERWTRDVHSMLWNVLVIYLLIALFTWSLGIVEFHVVVTVFFLGIVTLIGKGLITNGQWQAASYIPTLLLFAVGVFGSIIYGLTSFMLLVYVLAILSAALLQDMRWAWVVAVAAIAFHTLVTLFQPSINQETFLVSFLAMMLSVLGVMILLSYTTRELRRALDRAEQTNLNLLAEMDKRLETERSQREQETQLRRLADNMLDLVIQVDASWTMAYVSPSCQSVIGYSQAELLGKTIHGLVHPDDLSSATASLEAIVSKRSSERIEVRVLHGSGRYVLLEAVAKALLDPQEQLTGFVIGCRDISERKNAEEGLRLSEEKFAKAFQTSPDSIAINRMVDGLYLEVNEGFTRLLGYTPADVAGKTSIELNIWEDPQDRQRLIKALREHGLVTNMESRFVRKNGEIGTGLMSARLIEVVGERCILSITRDITDRKKAELALLESEEKFRSIVQSSPLGMHIYRYEPDGRLVFIGSNPAADTILGVENTQFVGKTIEQAFPPLARTQIPAEYRRVCTSGQTWIAEQVDYEDAQIKGAFEVRAFRTGPATMTAMFMDITERKKAEATVMNIAKGISAEIGQSFFTSLVEHLGRSLKADVAFISEMTGDNQMQSVAVYSGGRIVENFTIEDIKKSPCGQVVEQGQVVYQKGVSANFPQGGANLSKYEGYIGSALYDSTGQAMGCISVLYRQPMSDPGLVESTLQIFAVRASAELERRRIENALLDSEKRFRGLIENSADGVAILDPSGRVVYVSPAIKNLLGYDADEYRGQVIFDLLHAEEADTIRRIFNRLFTSPGAPVTGPLRFRHKDGSWKWFEAIAVNSLQEPAIQGVVVNFRDISDRVESENQLKKLNRSLQAISQCNLSMVQLTDEFELLQEICRITVEIGGYPSSWICYVENQPRRMLRPVAQFGFLKERSEPSPLSGTTDPNREEPPVKALRTHQPVIVEDLRKSTCKSPWCIEAIDRGYMAMITLPLFFDKEDFGCLMIYAPEASLFEGDEYTLLSQLANDLSYGIHTLRTRMDRDRAIRQIERTSADLETAYDATLEGWARALEMRERETAGHSRRVVEMTLSLAKLCGVSEAERVHIRRGALLHDIGKMGLPDSILLKPSALSSEEWVVMRQHPIYAFRLLNNIPYLRSAMDIPYNHHESWDGSGYPRGLKGDEIPIAARIFAVVDVWDALLSERPYRPSWPSEDVKRYLQVQSGKQFDPRIVELFITHLLNRDSTRPAP